MSERYKKRFYLTRRLYASGAPVIIESGTLLYDALSNASLCQLVFRSIQDKPIKSLRAVVQCLDAKGEPVEKPVDHRYQDLDLKREEEIGRDSAVVLPSPESRSFAVRVSQVAFADGEVWTDEDVTWDPLPEPPELEEYCGSEKQAVKFRRHFGTDCREAPLFTDELWFCACGAVNRAEELRCHRCRCRKSSLLNWSSEAAEVPVNKSADEGEEPYRLPFPPKIKRLLGVAAGLVLAGGLILALLLSRSPSPAPAPAEDPQAAAYAEAAAMLEAGELERAEDAFLNLGDYLDSAQQAQACRDAVQLRETAVLEERYEAAAALLESGCYSQAREAFLALGDFKDCPELACEAVYRKAQALAAFAEEHDSAGIRALLSSDPEKESLFFLPRERALALGARGVGDLQAACGQDPFRFVTGDGPDEELLVLEDAVAELYGSLGDYRDSVELALRLPEQADRSYEFFDLCAKGELPEAKEWLNTHPVDFADRQIWAQRVDRYLPFCGDWVHVSGDLTLLPMILGSEENCSEVRCAVLLDEEKAVLRFLLHEGDGEGPEMTAVLDESRFYLTQGEVKYMAVITETGNLSVAKFIDSFVISGVDFEGA